jgi:transporter family-2 protein
MSLVIDKFGLFGMESHALSVGRIAGAGLMVAGISLIASF